MAAAALIFGQFVPGRQINPWILGAGMILVVVLILSAFRLQPELIANYMEGILIAIGVLVAGILLAFGRKIFKNNDTPRPPHHHLTNR